MATAAQRFRRRQEKRLELRGKRYRILLRGIMRELFAAAITDRTLDAVAQGKVTLARLSLKPPPAKVARRVLRRVQGEAWTRGAEDFRKELRKVKAPREEFAEVFREDGLTAAQKAQRERVERARAEAREALRRFAATDEEAENLRQQAERLVLQARKSFRERLAEEIAKAKASSNPEEALRKLRSRLASVRGGRIPDAQARRIIARVEREAAERTVGTALEVDWQVSQRAGATVARSQVVDIALEFVATMDEETTPACQWFHGRKIDRDDPLVGRYTPQLHYNCRSAWRPVVAQTADLDFGLSKTRRLRFPKLGSAKGLTFRGIVGNVVPPASAPNNPPPKDAGDFRGNWVKAGFWQRSSRKAKKAGARRPRFFGVK